jgi:hypothetical protein
MRICVISNALDSTQCIYKLINLWDKIGHITSWINDFLHEIQSLVVFVSRAPAMQGVFKHLQVFHVLLGDSVALGCACELAKRERALRGNGRRLNGEDVHRYLEDQRKNIAMYL